MAAMSAAKNAIPSLSKSSEMAQSLPLHPTVSRVCFAAASRHQQLRNMTGEAGRRDYSPYNADESVGEPRDEVRETMDKAKEKTREMKDRAKERADNTADAVKEKTRQMNDKAYETKDKTANAAGDMVNKTKRQAHEASDKVRGAAETAADKTKEYAQGAKETTKGPAERVADAAKGAWGAAKDTTQKIKETVVGKSDVDDLDDYIEDHVKKPARDHRENVMDEDVVDARRQRVDEHDRDKL